MHHRRHHRESKILTPEKKQAEAAKAKKAQAELDRIAVEFTSLFDGSDLGRRVLKTLRKWTIESVAGPQISNDHLRHLEGQRYLVGLIEGQISLGHKIKRKEVANVAA